MPDRFRKIIEKGELEDILNRHVRDDERVVHCEGCTWGGRTAQTLDELEYGWAVFVESYPLLSLVPTDTTVGKWIEDTGVSERTLNCLQNANVFSWSVYRLKYVVDNDPFQLLRLPNFGRKCLYELQDLLAKKTEVPDA